MITPPPEKNAIRKLDQKDVIAILQSGYGVPVTTRIKVIKQPRGGILNPNLFEATKLAEIDTLNPDENVHASLVGLAVDYLTRFMTGTPVEEAFTISLKGARIAHQEQTAKTLLEQIHSLDEPSIIAATKLVGYDVCYRSANIDLADPTQINPDTNTCQNIRIMVERSQRFFQTYGPKTKDFLTFEGGYTHTVNKGDGDFMTADTLWDFKVSKKKPTKEHTLQLLTYWRLGVHSIHPEYKTITYIGIFNPRLNMVYRYKLDQLPQDTIDFVDCDVIEYDLEPGFDEQE